jgi:hypothetical protein
LGIEPLGIGKAIDSLVFGFGSWKMQPAKLSQKNKNKMR